MPQPECLQHIQNCFARAIYDNIAESRDELPFRKGDVLTVLEQNTSNMEGWWLCSLRGRQGICPGNRLRLIPGYYEDNSSRGPSPQMQFTDLRTMHGMQQQHIGSTDLSCMQRQGKRRSWHVQPNKVITPRRYNDVYLYDMPPSRCSPIPVHSVSPSCQSQGSDYDVPPKAVPVTTGYRCSPALSSCASPVSKDGSQDSYDVPRPLLHSQNMLTPSSSASSLSLTGESFSSSNRSSLANMPDYDVPRSHPKGPQLVLQQHQQSVYDVPPSSHAVVKELPLEIGSALDALERLQTETTSAISRLLGFVSSDWRTAEKLEANILEIKLVVIRLKTSLHDFKEFSEGALGNATRATDKNLASKLVTLVVALRSADRLIHECADKLDLHGWDVRTLARPADDDKYKPDELEQIIACTRSLTEDIRQAASFIQGNSTLLFKKDSSVQPATQTPERLEDYDYVNLESKEAYAKANSEIRDELPKELRKNYDCMIKNVEESVFKDINQDDKQILTFFAHQTAVHHSNLTQAIDAFFQTLEHNQPPKIFLAHGKFIVLSAHKLVHIGDTVGRGVSNTEVKARAKSCADALSGALATNVAKTKQAAQQFPSVTAVQEMVDSVVDISLLAKDLKMCLVQAAQP